MAELQDIIARIEQEGQQRCDRLREQARQRGEEAAQQLAQEREQWLTDRIAQSERDVEAAYRREKAALEQRYRKKELQTRQRLLQQAVGEFYDRLHAMDRDTFHALLDQGIEELGGGGVFSLDMGADSPAEWTRWAQEYPRAELRIGGEMLPRTLGFVLARDHLAYRFIASQRVAQLIQDRGHVLESLLFAGEV